MLIYLLILNVAPRSFFEATEIPRATILEFKISYSLIPRIDDFLDLRSDLRIYSFVVNIRPSTINFTWNSQWNERLQPIRSGVAVGLNNSVWSDTGTYYFVERRVSTKISLLGFTNVASIEDSTRNVSNLIIEFEIYRLYRFKIC